MTDETINHIISECSKLAQEYKTRLGGQGDPLGNVPKIKFDHASEWYMHNLAPVRENDTQTPMGL